MNASRLFCGSLALCSILALTSPASASELFAVNFAGSTPFFRMNQATGAVSVVNPAASTNIGDLTSNQTDKVWGVVLPPSPGGNALVTFDTLTGSVTSTVPIKSAAGSPLAITSIAWDPVGKLLYGNTTPAFGGIPGVDQLYTIDPTTGTATSVGPIWDGVSTSFTNLFALGFTQTGRLYGISDTTDQLLAINKLDGDTLVVGPVVNTGRAGAPIGFAFDIASRPEDGVMFLVDSGTQSLYRLDVLTGGVTLVGDYFDAAKGATNLVGLAFAVPIPEPGTWAMMLAGVALLGFIGARRARW